MTAATLLLTSTDNLMRKSIITLTAATFVTFANPHLAALAAQSSTPAARVRAEKSDSAKSGVYDLELTTEGGTLVGKLELKQANAGLTAVLTVGGHSPEVKSFTRRNKGYVIEAATPAFTVTYNLTFANDSLHGEFSMSSGTSGTVLGARKP